MNNSLGPCRRSVLAVAFLLLVSCRPAAVRAPSGAAVPGAPEPAAATPEFLAAGSTATVRTDRYEARFTAGALVYLENRLTGEVYATPPAALAARLATLPHGLGTVAGLDAAGLKAVDDLHPWQRGTKPADHPFVHTPLAEAPAELVRLSDRSAEVVWRGMCDGEQLFPDETFTLRLSVLPGSGDLEINATAGGGAPGVYGCGLAITGLDPALTVVLPCLQGYALRPATETPNAFASHWPYPWQASLVIVEGRAGSALFSMNDPELQDRYLHYRRAESDGFDLVLESINAAPFAPYTAAVSRPMRLNVYRGNWTQPAAAWRGWWAETFDVRPLAERPPPAADLRWISTWGTTPPAEFAAQAVHFCPQVWKKSPTVGDHGLFPFDMAPGPELGEQMAALLPRLQELRCEPYVYVNISHMCRAHPWAPRFWEHRTTPAFHDPDVAADPRFGSPDSFVVHTAAPAWQDLIVEWTKQIHARFGIRGFYMDCAAGQPNDARGLVNGMNDCQGQVALMRRQRREMPGIFLGAEYTTEVTAQVVDIAGIGYDTWFGEGARAAREGNVHPIIGFLYNRYVHLMYFGGMLPTFTEALFRTEMAPIPAALHSGEDYEQVHEFFATWNRLRCGTRLRPEYPDPWEANVRAYFADDAGNRYRVFADTPREGRLVRSAPAGGGEELLYWRIKDRGEARVTADTAIEGWLAYRGDTAIGLNPKSEYFYAARPRYRDWEIAALPDGAVVESCRAYRNGLLVLRLATADGQGAAAGRLELRTSQPVHAALTPAGPVALEDLGAGADGRRHLAVAVDVPGAVVFLACEPDSFPAAADAPAVLDLSARPLRFAAQLGHNGVRTPVDASRAPRASLGEHALVLIPRWTENGWLEYPVALPAVAPGQRLLLSLRSAITQEHKGNTYQFVLQVNGVDVARTPRQGGTPPAEVEYDLTAHAGRTVLVSFGLERCYLFDWARILEPRIRVE
jgi:hypothetical protein